MTTSRRTPAGIAARLDAALESPHFVYEWQPDATDNPYRALLALADRLIVTGESMSMLAEACAARRPVYVFDMHDRGPMSATARLRWLKDALRYRAWTHRLAQVLAPERLRRDVSRLHAALMAEGRAVWLGDEFPDREPPPLPGHEAVAARVRALLDTDPDDRNLA